MVSFFVSDEVLFECSWLADSYLSCWNFNHLWKVYTVACVVFFQKCVQNLGQTYLALRYLTKKLQNCKATYTSCPLRYIFTTVSFGIIKSQTLSDVKYSVKIFVNSLMFSCPVSLWHTQFLSECRFLLIKYLTSDCYRYHTPKKLSYSFTKYTKIERSMIKLFWSS